mmetsp:Transcript_21365/g.35337  ORF Transcript_21365/g.35337 Transcript_21365/m.35337 type:complete len:367 (-) Transcript_21365:97-1197(-)|eukprot:CAMPEP_0119028338 /NCGR_PEP_ID=MMETSP1176-20130426/38702_1 /TAXON_ID=265551 /ORGANISM="Synedropsis recta cf, Strain CCMP1620" /LENGTH=366 /DNA_ID=CAMNT_0006984457 /DNA_START=185 /DNA_END=1285 /DNA_ORIENTATION=-
MACRECHLAKTKCDNKSNPCVRCAKLSLKCVRHMSRQGHGRKERRRRSPGKTEEQQQLDAKKKAATAAPIVRLEDDVAKRTCKLAPGHYGLNSLIRTWIGYAITRRSTSLMTRAFALANKCGISMDQILCGDHDFPGEGPMEFLAKTLLKPGSQQVATGKRLTLTEVPQILLDAVNCSSKETEQRHPENRWVYMRERMGGTDRHYVSRAFERDVVSWQTIQDTWKANRTEVFGLWLPTWEEKLKYSQGLIHQFSLHNVKGIPLAPARIAGTKIRLATSEVVDVECIVCGYFHTLDHGYLWLEYSQPIPDEERFPVTKEYSAKELEPLSKFSAEELEPLSSADDKLDFWVNIDEFEWTSELEEIMNV